MTPLLVLGLLVAALLSLFFSTLTYALREFSRVRLGEYLERHGKISYLDETTRHASDLVFVTAVWRLLANMVILLVVLSLLDRHLEEPVLRYLLAILITAAITLLVSVAIPHAAAHYASSAIVGACAGFLSALRLVTWPATKIMHAIDALAASAAGDNGQPESDQIEKEILSVVEEGEKEGVVDEEEREMIESVIEFHNIHVGQIMTARPEIVALPLSASLEHVKRLIEESGHSRLPVYDGTLDQIVGVLYARDLLKHLGEPPEKFEIRSAMRPAYYVPETKPLRDLLNDFRAQKVHLAIVLDEYGGTAGLITIEDVLEELVGDISDEHEPHEPAMLKRTGDTAAEADARIYIDELNHQLGLNLPEDAGYETLGGFVSTTLGRIPAKGAVFEHNGVRYTILDAEPQKVNRVKIELFQPAAQKNG